MLTRIIFSTVAMLFLFSSGCLNTTFEHPLIAPEKSKAAPELFGAYLLEPGPDNTTVSLDERDFPGLDEQPEGMEKPLYPSTLHIGAAGEGYPSGFLKIVWIGAGNNKELDYVAVAAFSHKVGDDYVIHLPASKGQESILEQKVIPGKWNPGQFHGYSFLAFRKLSTGWAVHRTNDGYFKQAIQAKKIAGWIHPSQRIHSADFKRPDRKTRRSAESKEIQKNGGDHAPQLLVKLTSEELGKMLESNEGATQFFDREIFVQLKRIK